MMTKAMTESQKALVVAHMYIADNYIFFNYTANPATVGLSQEDLRQTGYLALCKAAIHYNGSIKFESFAKKVIQNSLSDCFRQFYPKAEASLDKQIGVAQEDGTLYNFLPDASAQIEFQEIEVQDIFSRCKQRHSGIIQKGIEALELKMQGFTGPEIAAMYGCKPNEITAWISRARQQMCADLGGIDAVKSAS